MSATLAQGKLAFDECELVERFARRVALDGTVVVEIGGCVPAATVESAGVASWIAVDPRNDTARTGGPVVAVAASAAEIPLGDGSADAAFSCNAFQHIRPVDEVLAELARVLRSGGTVYASFGPVWSAPDGAQVENLVVGERRYDFWTDSLLPAWAHLVLDPLELELALQPVHGGALAAALANWVADSTWINRLPLHALLDCVGRSELELIDLRGCSAFGYRFEPPQVPEPWATRLSTDAVAAAALERHGIPPEHLLIRDVELELRRP